MKSVDKLRHLAKEMGWASVAELADEIEQEAGGQNITGNGELLPCPFCGCTAIYVTHTHYYDDEDTVCVFCNGCKSVVMLESNEAEGINDKTRAEAIVAWNTRAELVCHEVMVDKYFHGCSECGYMWEYMYRIGKRERPNYCPNCGARVVE